MIWRFSRYFSKFRITDRMAVKRICRGYWVVAIGVWAIVLSAVIGGDKLADG
jgi:hypothetical protein